MTFHTLTFIVKVQGKAETTNENLLIFAVQIPTILRNTAKTELLDNTPLQKIRIRKETPKNDVNRI